MEYHHKEFRSQCIHAQMLVLYFSLFKGKFHLQKSSRCHFSLRSELRYKRLLKLYIDAAKTVFIESDTDMFKDNYY